MHNIHIMSYINFSSFIVSINSEVFLMVYSFISSYYKRTINYDTIKELKFNSDVVLASFDVESLFTNIPLSETCDII